MNARKIVIALLLLCACLAWTAQAGAAGSRPAWRLDVIPMPTNFAPGAHPTKSGGPFYLVVATNVGGEATSGPLTITDTLPNGLIPTDLTTRTFDPGAGNLSCSIVDQTVTCTAAGSLRPGFTHEMRILVDVEAGAPPSVLNQVNIEGGGAAATSVAATTQISSQPAPFDFLAGPAGLSAPLLDADGNPATGAGSHPYGLSVNLGFPTEAPGGFLIGAGHLRDASSDLPPGEIVNPSATPVLCTEAELVTENSPGCPPASQIGTATVITVAATPEASTVPLYNMIPPPGVASNFGFDALGIGVMSHVFGSVRSDGDYGLTGGTADILALPGNPAFGARLDLWGDPSDESHSGMRGRCRFANQVDSCPTEAQQIPALTAPGHCTGAPTTTTATAHSWEAPTDPKQATYESADLNGNPVSISGCNQLEFKPTIALTPTTNLTDSPAGLDVTLSQPQPPPPARVGAPLSCTRGTWRNSPSGFATQWLRNGTPIPGATDPTYTIEDADVGATLQCEVTASNTALGPARAASNAVVIPPLPSTSPPTPATPTISPTVLPLASGATVTCAPGTWGGQPSFSYRWFKNGTLLAGQSEPTLAIPAGEAPLTLQCEVIGTNAGGTALAYSANLESEPPLEPPLPDPSTRPRASIPLEDFPRAPAILRDARVTLPAGMSANPSQADGLAACSEDEIGYRPSDGEIHFSKAPAACPEAARIGSLEVTTPLLGETDQSGTKIAHDPETGAVIPRPLHGSVFLAEPIDNPFGSLLAIYLALEDPRTGTVAKLAGQVIPDPVTGQLTTVFEENPQLPLEDVTLHLFGGARGSLITPLSCATHTTTTDLIPWSAPEGLPAHPESSFATTAAPGGGPCPGSDAQAPNTPSFSAGTISPQAGAYSPFVLKLSREDGSQRLTNFDTTLPPGLTGKLAGIPACPEAALAQAASRSHPEEGILERNAPSCPASSALGTVTVGAGAGPTPFHTNGTVYLAGPYMGAPLSIAVITPAIAGPFDLGVVVVREGLVLDRESAQIHTVGDPFPTILHGIPLDLRSVAVKLDRPQFTLNPTSCDPMAITAGATSALGATAPLSAPFQVGGCPELGFKPKLSLALKGSTKRATNPRLIADLKFPPGGSFANVAKAEVKLPIAAFLDNSHIKTICTRVQFAADTCPPGSIYGKATATTPLTDYPLTGPVYLRSSSNPLPDLVVKLKGPAYQPLEVDLVGRTDSVKGALRNTFDAVPDVPASSFHLELFGGKRGLVELSRNLCKGKYHASVKLDAQNGKTYDTTPLVGDSCKKGKKGGGKKKHRRRGGR